MTWSDAHEHTPRCWWDHRRAGWTCPPPVAVTTLPAQASPVELETEVGALADVP
ncbi:hypothetical protein [Nocardioides marmoribigeumensis]|uniref:Uncharacterized protein n=1 Tax=Nocardioides marmoribigeumensis TaxID=433649 RepID=A0ABU2BUN6_9ACTN|nr:hypothetical protein [Nocardioides marmoribigeumensis]MDR7362347.1 hypothetical protein [Nocardioides marmoribigeumensis]